MFDITVAAPLALQLRDLGVDTPEKVGALVAKQLKIERAHRLAGGSGPALHDESSDLAVQRPMCPRGDSNTRHAV